MGDHRDDKQQQSAAYEAYSTGQIKTDVGTKSWNSTSPHQNKTIMIVEGNIKLIGETVKFDSGFTKRQLVVTTNDRYPQDIPIDFVKDDVSKLNELTVGTDVVVSINLRGNEHNGKYYVSLNGWKVDVSGNPSSDLPV